MRTAVGVGGRLDIRHPTVFRLQIPYERTPVIVIAERLELAAQLSFPTIEVRFNKLGESLACETGFNRSVSIQVGSQFGFLLPAGFARCFFHN